MQQHTVEWEVADGNSGPARGGGQHFAGQIDDPGVVGPDGRDDRVAVGPGIAFYRKPAFVGRDPTSKIDLLGFQRSPQRGPVQVKTDGDADAAKIQVEGSGLAARFDTAANFFFHRIIFAVAPDQRSAAVEHQRLVVIATLFDSDMAGHQIEMACPAVRGEHFVDRTWHRFGDLREPGQRHTGQRKGLWQQNQVRSIAARCLQNRLRGRQVLLQRGVAQVVRRACVFQRGER